MKTNSLLVMAASVVVAGCTAGSNSGSAENDPTAYNIDSAKIETCWKSAGIESDLYRFMTPAEALGLQAGGVVSQEQASKFNACIRA